ncbi:LytTR family DNA-binding domain-containing protein [Gallintestinimicrobium sp.]|uniref:LytTR family DNA-binding domain-containing protein n=1 Tax=Gallintestinimicrobium sp. TaxID=2981655 RepID=UPI0039953570
MNWSSILYAETHGRHTILHTTDQVYESVERLSALAERYGAFFIRCHESYLINPSFVQKNQPLSGADDRRADHPDPGEKIYRSEGSSAAPPTFFQPYFTTPFFKIMLAY